MKLLQCHCHGPNIATLAGFAGNAVVMARGNSRHNDSSKISDTKVDSGNPN
jgi:hypothetical protein